MYGLSEINMPQSQSHQMIGNEHKRRVQKADQLQGKSVGLDPQLGSIVQRTRIDPGSLTSADVMSLQRTIGNQATAKLVRRNTAPIRKSHADKSEHNNSS